MREGGRRPRVPLWLLAAIVAACLATAAWLFWADSRLEDGTARDAQATEERELAEGVLEVPEEDDDTDGGPTGADRRSEEGRERLDDDAIEDGETRAEDLDDATGTDEPLPAILEHLAGRTIVLAAASANAQGDEDRLVRVGNLRVPCAAAADADRIGAELALIRRLRRVLDRAGARVVLVTAEDGSAGCVDARVRRLEQGDLALVVRVGGDATLVYAARPTKATDPASRRASNAFAAELAGVLGLERPGSSASRHAASMLARAGAIDLDGGAAVAFVEPVATSDDAADARALDLARAMALTLVRAGSAPAG